MSLQMQPSMRNRQKHERWGIIRWMHAAQRERKTGAFSSAQKCSDHESVIHPRIMWRSRKVQVARAIDEELKTLIEDTRKFLREDLEDFEINQQVIGTKCLFWGFSIEAWKGIDFSGYDHAACDGIVNQHCMKCHCECWKDRNENFMMKKFNEKDQ